MLTLTTNSSFQGVTSNGHQIVNSSIPSSQPGPVYVVLRYVPNANPGCSGTDSRILKIQNDDPVCSGADNRTLEEQSTDVVSSNTDNRTLEVQNTDAVSSNTDNRTLKVRNTDRVFRNADSRPSIYEAQNADPVYTDANSGTLEVGNRYRTFREASSSITSYCEQNYHAIKTVRSLIRDSTNPDYYYEWIIYGCIHGKKYKPKSTKGVRPNQTSFLMNCPFKINLRVALKPKPHYKITQINLSHNHDIGPSIYNLYPKQRRLNSQEENDLKDLMCSNLSNKELRLLIQKKTGKLLTPYDINNLKRRNANHCDSLNVSDLLVKVLNKLVETDDCNVLLETDENEDFKFLLIQTEMMRHLTKQLSAVLFMDEMTNINMEGFPLYAIMCEDGNEVGRPICYIFVSNKKTDSLNFALKKFIELNPSVTASCKIIVTDKNLNKMNVIQELFPSAINILCTSHILEHWIEKISVLSTSVQRKNEIIAILKLILYSNTEDDYFRNLGKLKQTCPADFFSYFSTDWHSCKEKFVLAFTRHQQNLDYTNSNQIETHNQKIKSFLKPKMHIHVAVKELLNYVKTVTNSLIHTSFKDVEPTLIGENITQLYDSFSAICNEKACASIFREIKKFQNGSYIIEKINDSLCYIISKDQNHTIENLTSCSCSLNSQNNLPCQHIFAARLAFGELLFHINIIGVQWLKHSTMVPSAPCFENVYEPGLLYSEDEPEETEMEKFLKARVLTDRIAKLSSRCGTKEFNEKMEFLSDLESAWENNDEVMLFERKEYDFVPYFSVLNSNIDTDTSHENFSSKSCNELNESNKLKVKQFSSNEKIPSIKLRRGKPKSSLPYKVPSKSARHLKPEVPSKKIKKYILERVQVQNAEPNNKVSLFDFELINGNNMLNNNIINAGQELIKLKFPHIAGLQDVSLGAALEFEVIKTEFVQILHCQSFMHWIAASTLNAPPGTVYVYDSLNEAVPLNAVPQLCNIMSLEASCLTIISKPMQIQENEVDCGLFALAAVMTLLSGGDPSDVTYNVELMRNHFASCFTMREMEEFPTVDSDITCRSIERSQIFNLNCECRQPMLSNTSFKKLEKWFKCKICNSFYHKSCKTRCCSASEKNFL